MKKRPPDSKRSNGPKQGTPVEVNEGKSAPDAKKILDLFGTIDWDNTYDHKAARGRRS